MSIAITRQVSPAIEACELTHLKRQEINYDKACRQHDHYETWFTEQGHELISLKADENLPDCVFVEDMAVIVDEVAIMTSPGAASRQKEISLIKETLRPYRKLKSIQPPGQLDGGDVLCMGKKLFVGVGGRTNLNGATQLKACVAPYGYETIPIPLSHCLHLKTAVSQIGSDMLLINPEWVEPSCFEDFQKVEVHNEEPFAANALYVKGETLFSLAYPKTLERLSTKHLNLHLIDMSELAKAEAGLTCCSLILNTS